MKRLISVLVIAILLVSSISFVFAMDFQTDSKNNKSIIEEELNKLIDKQMKLYRWDLMDSSYDVISQSVENDKLTLDYNVAIIHRLDFPSVKDVPVLQGKLKYLNELKTDPAGNGLKINYVETKVNEWEKNLQSYIDQDQELQETIRVVALLDKNNEVIKGSIEFYFQEADDSFTPADEFLVIATDDEVFQSSYNDIKDRAKKVKEKDPSDPVMTIVPTYDDYNGTAAVNYANTYVKTTSLVCQSGSTTLQNKANYNQNYAAYTCNDCANYVSQCLYAGGIPQTTTWAPAKTPWINTGYSTSIYGLKDYMLEYDYAIPVSKSSVEPGGFIAMTTISHVMFVVYNDGYTVKYDAHSSDRYQSSTTTGTNMEFYNMQCIHLAY